MKTASIHRVRGAHRARSSRPAARAQTQTAPTRTPDVIFVPTPQEVVDAMLKVAKVTKDDFIYDLGSGDGRIPITAAKVYGRHAASAIDIDPVRIQEANANAKGRWRDR